MNNDRTITFAISDAKLVEENTGSKFATVELDFFASGDNRHDMWVSEETLLRTADTIKNCPLVWKYDPVLDDAYTHDDDEVPCGFVPETATVTNRTLPDGRIMLSVTAYVWKRYTGKLLDFFRRDDGKKPVSVEIGHLNLVPLDGERIEIKDFEYECITVLGTFVTPAIPGAEGRVVSFSLEAEAEEYAADLYAEFSAIPVDMSIPDDVRAAVKDAISKHQKADAVSISFAKTLSREKEISQADAEALEMYFNEKSSASNEAGTSLRGGALAKRWISKLTESLRDREGKTRLTFPYKSIADINPALKGIQPPVSLSQANAIARQADAIGSDGETNGWAVAISSFKKTHKVEDGRWVKNTSADMADINKAEDNKESTMPEDVIEKMAQPEETPAEEEKAESTEKQEEEKEEKTEKKFAFPTNFSHEQMSALFAGDEDEMCKMAHEELAKGEFADPSVVMGGMFAKMMKMSAAIAQMSKDAEVYMAEMESLKKFKADVEESQKEFSVKKFMAELDSRVHVPDDERTAMLEDAKAIKFAELSAWMERCKVKSFDFAAREKVESNVERIGLPFKEGQSPNKNDLWK